MTNIEKLEELPYKESKREYFIRVHGSTWDRKDHYSKERSPYRIARLILENNIGKSFDLAFHYYCSKVPKHEQHYFLGYFRDIFRYNEWYVDKNGNIQYNKWKRNPIYSIKSEDYKTEERHKVTGHKKDHFFPILKFPEPEKKHWIENKIIAYEYCGVETWDRPRYTIPRYKRYYAQKSDFEIVIVQGWIKIFESRNDPEYRKLTAEKIKADKKKKRDRKKPNDEWYNSYLIKDKERREREEEENKIKIISHGFDLKTSFRNEKEHL